MSQPQPGAPHRVEMSPHLHATLQRATGYARQQLHRYITVEHVLLALNEDPDASLMLQACSLDQARLASDVSGYLGHIEERFQADQPAEPVMDAESSRIINSAVAASQKSRRPVVNGAIVLAAIIGDGRSAAANMLRAQGLTFEAAIKALQQGAMAPTSAPVPPRPAAPPTERPHVAEEPDTQRPSGRHAETEPDSGHQGRAFDPAFEQARHDAAQSDDGPRSGNGTEAILADARRRVDATRQGRTGEPKPAPMPAQMPAARPPPPGQRREGAGQPSVAAGERPEVEPVRGEAPPQPRVEPPRVPPSNPAHRLQERLRHQSETEGRGPVPGDPRDVRPSRGQAADQGPGPGSRPPAPPQVPSPQVPASQIDRPPPDRSRDLSSFGQPPRPPSPPPPVQGDRRLPPSPSPRPEVPGGFNQGAPMRPPSPPLPAPYDGGGRPSAPPMADERALPRTELPPDIASDRAAQHRQPQHTPGMPPPAAQSGSRVPPDSAGRVLAGQLQENIPRRFRAWVPVVAEVRVARADIANLGAGMAGSGAVTRHDIVVTKAMSVRLRAPEGGFYIQTASPETQWIENHLGILSDDYASWRWTITPKRHGKGRLQLIVSARSMGGDGLAAETALPDRVIDVTVSVNYARTAAKWGGWVAAAIVGGLLAKFGEHILSLAHWVMRGGGPVG